MSITILFVQWNEFRTKAEIRKKNMQKTVLAFIKKKKRVGISRPRDEKKQAENHKSSHQMGNILKKKKWLTSRDLKENTDRRG